jgi:hypothetical protein
VAGHPVGLQGNGVAQNAQRGQAGRNHCWLGNVSLGESFEGPLGAQASDRQPCDRVSEFEQASGLNRSFAKVGAHPDRLGRLAWKKQG